MNPLLIVAILGAGIYMILKKADGGSVGNLQHEALMNLTNTFGNATQSSTSVTGQSGRLYNLYYWKVSPTVSSFLVTGENPDTIYAVKRDLGNSTMPLSQLYNQADPTAVADIQKLTHSF